MPPRPDPLTQKAISPMAEQSPPIEFEDVPLDEARRMGRGPRMEPMLYDTLRKKIQSLSTDATRLTIPEDTHPTTRGQTYCYVSRQ
jgi:hypothetical protein